ncbi:MAG: PEPxxWA-CTERM sorting domain-containing protein [Thermaurantiacus tibetensis]|uniref:PEPxxWA-CTERM sorting domain-containing protein n=1 Tax=Thermaurantiacus tibetensis TaxID=2759035 RepID=UPI001F3C4F5E|nr:PEPxxWA-CTERM sorting domain-containing protein [Thermaurantiacus tibetensis]
MNLKLLAAAGVLALGTAGANAAAIITNGTIGLGVNNEGHLNLFGGPGIPPSAGGTAAYGLRDLRTGFEATAPGCLCEGWGISNGLAGWTASVDTGGVSVTLVSFGSTASTATSVVTAGSVFEVTHAFQPSASPDLMEVIVTIRNISGGAIANTLYRRGMDWDIEPTPFREYVTIGGTAAATAVTSAVNNGFCNVNPLFGCFPILPGGTGDFVDLGPSDHGANFDFNFGPLADGASVSFSIFYGASPTQVAAFNALNAVGAEVFSLGKSSDNLAGTLAGRSIFIFGFKGVGGTVVPPGGVIPEPGTWAMLIAGFGMVGFAARRRRAAVATA